MFKPINNQKVINKKEKVLSQEEREGLKEIADGQADVTPDGGKRNPNWTPFLQDDEEYWRENPYRKK